MISGLVTIKLILVYMTPELQGYYYSINNLLQMQLFLELGLGIIIIHLSSSEFAKLRWSETLTLEGDEKAKHRIASLLQKTTKFYGFMGLLFIFITIPLGIFILSNGGLELTYWLIPWVLIVMSAAVKLACIPINMIFAGAGKINIVSRYQTFATIFAVIAMWGGIIMGLNLYALILLSWVTTGFINFNLIRRFWPALRELFAIKVVHPVSWKKEIWPYQSRSGFNVIADWIFLQSATPIILNNQGSVEAGKIGITLSIIMVFIGLGASWMITRSVEFSGKLALGKTQEAYNYFISILSKIFPVVFLGLLGVLLSIWLINTFDIPFLSQYKDRLLEPTTAFLLIVFLLSNFLFNSFRIYLRAYKKEPFFFYSIFYSIILFSSNIYFSFHSVYLMCLSQAIIGVIFCLGFGSYYFHYIRKKWDLEIHNGLAIS